MEARQGREKRRRGEQRAVDYSPAEIGRLIIRIMPTPPISEPNGNAEGQCALYARIRAHAHPRRNGADSRKLFRGYNGGVMHLRIINSA